MSAGVAHHAADASRALLPHGRRRVGPVYAIAALIAATLPGAVAAVAAPCWRPPVTAVVADPFRQPDCRWCPGNRGIEYATSSGDVVTSAAAGTVSFAGAVAGIHYVVVEVGNGWRITYGNLERSDLRVGETVVAGMAIGTAAGAFHFGVRDGDVYIDPGPYIGKWQFRVRLVPTDGGGAAPGPVPRLRCERAEPTPFVRAVAGRELSHRR